MLQQERDKLDLELGQISGKGDGIKEKIKVEYHQMLKNLTEVLDSRVKHIGKVLNTTEINQV